MTVSPSSEANTLRPAFYSLVQFCPDPARQEYVNIAVILESPGFDYVGFKVLPWMDRAIHCLAPGMDASIIRLATHAIARQYGGGSPESSKFKHLDDPRPRKIREISRLLVHEHGSYWNITEPRASFLLPDQPVESELEDLFEELVERRRRETRERRNKEWVRETTVEQLSARDIEIVVKPPPVKGASLARIPFDALHRNGISTYLEFLSFDKLKEPSTRDVAALLFYVSDFRKAAHEGEANIATVIQPPRRKAWDEPFQEALAAIRANDIAAFGTDEDDYSALADGLADPDRLNELATLTG